MPTTLDVAILITGLVLVVVHFFANMSLTIRRLHDCGLRGWWYLLTPIFSPVVFVILCLLKETEAKISTVIHLNIKLRF